LSNDNESYEQNLKVIVLRSEEIIENFDDSRIMHSMVLEEVVDHSEPDVNEAWEEEERKIEEKGKDIIDETQFEPESLAPQSLTSTLKDPQNAFEYEVFEKIEFILQLLAAITQTLSIVEPLKDLSVV